MWVKDEETGECQPTLISEQMHLLKSFFSENAIHFINPVGLGGSSIGTLSLLFIDNACHPVAVIYDNDLEKFHFFYAYHPNVKLFFDEFLIQKDTYLSVNSPQGVIRIGDNSYRGFFVANFNQNPYSLTSRLNKISTHNQTWRLSEINPTWHLSEINPTWRTTG